ncbi:O-antigen ligase family protein [Aquamicrobium defluvii]|uniref:O-antigen ligase n=1 Tax=Aquamicrobium defluvii TaxID=69279 RepID=A0A4R6YF22_9HYPH|nr:O-antigen ligase family protein [Aquamicrobium defluvii]TDR34878.1 O-antigen ligase [Aquamicrobium defluvii]
MTVVEAGAVKGLRGSRNALGLCLLACLLVGGATQRGVLVDAILQMIVIAGAAYALMSAQMTKPMRAGIVLLVLILVLGIMQLLPLPLTLLELARPADLLPFVGNDLSEAVSAAPISLSVSRTVEATIFALAPVVFFIAAVSLPQEKIANLLPFFVIGLVCNLIAGGLQYSFSTDATLGDLLGYGVMVGMFANVNHFSTLVFASLPLIVYFGFFHDRAAIATLLLVLTFLVLLAAGSRAGILIGLGVVAISVGSLIWRGRVGTIAMVVLFASFAAYGYGALIQIGSQQLDPDFGRKEFALTTWNAILDNWVWGTGFGTFDLVYPAYEKRDMVHNLYVNHAHNDFLELLLEGGAAAMVVFAVYVAMVIVRAVKVYNRPLQRLALLSIVVILLHSIVDYPLRTMAIAMTFAFFNVLFFSDIGTRPGLRKGYEDKRRRAREEVLPPYANGRREDLHDFQ